jgi:hypothetical protein
LSSGAGKVLTSSKAILTKAGLAVYGAATTVMDITEDWYEKSPQEKLHIRERKGLTKEVDLAELKLSRAHHCAPGGSIYNLRQEEAKAACEALKEHG